MKRKTWDDLGCLARDFTFYVENSKTMLRKLHGLAKFVSKRMKQGQEFTISQLAQCAVIKNVVDWAIGEAYWMDFIIPQEAIQETNEYYAGLVLEVAESMNRD